MYNDDPRYGNEGGISSYLLGSARASAGIPLWDHGRPADTFERAARTEAASPTL